MITMTTLADALKIFYLPSIVDQMSYKVNSFYSTIESNSDEVTGSKIRQAMKYGRNGGIGARDEYGTLPTSGQRKYAQAEFPVKNIFGRIEITDKMIRVSANDKGSFVNALQVSLDDLLADAKDQFSRMLFGNGSGKLATCTAQSSVTTLTLDSVQYLCEGMFIDICDNVGTVKQAGREILFVDTVNKQIGISGSAVTNLATDIIVISGAYGLELTGLDAVFQSTGSLYGIDRAANKWLVPNFQNVAGELTELQVQTGIDNAEIRAGSKIDYLMCSYGVARAYQYLMSSMRRNIEVMQLKGGYSVMSYNGIPVDKNAYCQSGVMYQLERPNWKLHKISDWDWMDRDGAILNRVSNKASYEATLVLYADLGCRKPAGNTKLYGITEH